MYAWNVTIKLSSGTILTFTRWATDPKKISRWCRKHYQEWESINIERLGI